MKSPITEKKEELNWKKKDNPLTDGTIILRGIARMQTMVFVKDSINWDITCETKY